MMLFPSIKNADEFYKVFLYTVITLSFQTDMSGKNSADPDQTAPRGAF